MTASATLLIIIKSSQYAAIRHWQSKTYRSLKPMTSIDMVWMMAVNFVEKPKHLTQSDH